MLRLEISSFNDKEGPYLKLGRVFFFISSFQKPVCPVLDRLNPVYSRLFPRWYLGAFILLIYFTIVW